ncbi:MAG: hypothetical protein F6K19_46670 [Cyanothece sp. SIO1E1]|nr:hypothetical protein [Cyanothece sp. SIO1E1]
MDRYFDTCIEQYLERVDYVRSLVSRPISHDFQSLYKIFDDDLKKIRADLLIIRDVVRFKEIGLEKVKFRKFRRCVADFLRIEQTILPALLRHDNKEEKWVNKVLQRIVLEIAFPLVPPTISCTSSDYFDSYMDKKLLLIPLAESHFLLHLPDIFHELGHSLLFEEDEPCLRKYIHSWQTVLSEISADFVLKHREHSNSRSRNIVKSYNEVWAERWANYWGLEFFCDLFAIYVCGPAYAWAHLHLCVKRGGDPYFLDYKGEEFHPSNDSRMQVILLGLERIGFNEEVGVIREKWNSVITTIGAKKCMDYELCYPMDKLRLLESKAYQGFRTLNCVLYKGEMDNTIVAVLNEAWVKFWNSSISYNEWEKETIEKLSNFEKKYIIKEAIMNVENLNVNQGDHSIVNIADVINISEGNKEEIFKELNAANIGKETKGVVRGLLDEIKSDLSQESKEMIVKKIKTTLGSGIKQIPSLVALLGGS